MRYLSILLFMAIDIIASAQNVRTVNISNLFTTHLVFDTEIKYGDLSNTEQVTASVVERSRNMLSVIALAPFDKPANVTVLESNGNIHTFILNYEEYPNELIVDLRSGAEKTPVRSSVFGQAQEKVSTLWSDNAPPLWAVLDMPQSIYHLTARSGRVSLTCCNIFSYSDITYLVLALDNQSGVSFEISDATFRVEPRDSRRRKLVNGSNVIPQNREGTLTASAGSVGKAAYALDKLTLSDDQVLIVDVYEAVGQRHLELTLTSKDINLADSPVGKEK